MGADFIQYWAASRLALAGDAVTVYDPDKFYAAEREVTGVFSPIPGFTRPPFYS